MKIILNNSRMVFLDDSFNVEDYIKTYALVENPEFLSVILDSDNRVLWGRYVDNSTTDNDLSGYTMYGAPVTRIINELITKYNL